MYRFYDVINKHYENLGKPEAVSISIIHVHVHILLP